MNRELSRLISTLLQRIPIERIICSDADKHIYFDELSDNLIKDIMLTYCPSIGDASIESILEEIRTQVNPNVMESKAPDGIDKINIFSMLSYYVRDILTFHENKVVCKYSKIIEWNELTRVIGKDLPIAAFIAYEDCESGEDRKNLFWPPVIGHNNDQINRMLSKGMAENHFHLRGSTPYFDISWINLMNHPTKPEYVEKLNSIEENLRDKNKKAQIGITKQSFQDMIKEAALIRLYLSKLLTGTSQNDLYKYNFLNIQSIKETYRDRESEDNSNHRIVIQNTVRSLLSYPEMLQLKTMELQAEIDITWWHNRFPDYLLEQVRKPMNKQYQEYWLLSGERWFLYQMLKAIFEQNVLFSREEFNLFLAYIRIKNELRGELIQNNSIYGFDNFQIYQDRKDDFSHTSDWIQSEGVLARLAVRDVLSNSSVKHLEIRISPAKTAQQIMEDIRGYDYAILRKDEEDKIRKTIKQFNTEKSVFERIYDKEQLSLQNRYHYVLHFTKQKDVTKGVVSKLECRHYEYRKKLIDQTAEIILFRQLYPEYAQRIVGIDACSREIGCRPEVFGRAFRTLKHYVPPETNTEFIKDFQVHQLKFTYHVGEDYLDVIDGLRAIDEAIRFLTLGSGDRLGHAMALGIDARNWYEKRGNKVVLSMQDYIDNIVWFHHNLINFGIENMSSLKGWLEEKYSQYFNYVYQPFVRNWNNDNREILIGGDEYYADLAQNGFDINTYYLSWLLRGDKPELYKTGGFVNEKVKDQWKKYSINAKYIKRQDIRNIPQVALLYSMYHYNPHVKQRGSEVKTFRLHPDYATAVSLIQKKMQVQIDRLGISIETNPSSNYKISSLESYSDHPIVSFYNNGLIMDVEKLAECPQMNVSINTDDDGVFCTRLENEFALMASTLEEEVDDDGKPLYKRQNIYKWLDNIREMGLHQSFYELT